MKAIHYKDLNLPPFRSNEGLGDNEAYIQSSLEQINYLIEKNHLNKNSKILDFGCGQGRLVNGLKHQKLGIGGYIGVDTDQRSISWCNKWITPYSPVYKFIHLPAYNARYNRKAKSLKELPFKDKKFNLIFLNSVFSHMLSADIEFYLKEFKRVIASNGIVYITAFIEENVPDVSINPKGYIKKSEGALHRVRYEKKYFFSLIDNSGFKVISFEHKKIKRAEQSVLVLKNKK